MKRKPVIMLVDDETCVISALKRMLMNLDVHVITAASGDQGLMILEGIKVDLLISDLNMPGQHGMDFVSTVSTLYPDTLTIILTGNSSIENTLNAINNTGVYKFFTKPWEESELLCTIEQAIGLIATAAKKDPIGKRRAGRLEKSTLSNSTLK